MGDFGKCSVGGGIYTIVPSRVCVVGEIREDGDKLLTTADRNSKTFGSFYSNGEAGMFVAPEVAKVKATFPDGTSVVVDSFKAFDYREDLAVTIPEPRGAKQEASRRGDSWTFDFFDAGGKQLGQLVAPTPEGYRRK